MMRTSEEQLGDRPAHAARCAGDDRDPPCDAAFEPFIVGEPNVAP
jgi:hypothetical protein